METFIKTAVVKRINFSVAVNNSSTCTYKNSNTIWKVMLHKRGFDTKIDLWTYNSRVCITKFVSANPRYLVKGGKIYAVQTLLETKKSSQTLKVNVLHYMGGRPSNHFILVKSAGSFFPLAMLHGNFLDEKMESWIYGQKILGKGSRSLRWGLYRFLWIPSLMHEANFHSKEAKNTFSSQKI